MSILRVVPRFTKFDSFSLVLKRCNSKLLTHSDIKETEKLNNEVESDGIDDKVVYNSIFKHGRIFDLRKQSHILDESVYEHYKSEGPQLQALKYFETDRDVHNYLQHNLNYQSQESSLNENEKEPLEENSSKTDFSDVSGCKTGNADELNCFPVTSKKNIYSKQWMKDYNNYAELSLDLEKQQSQEENGSITLNIYYGTADPNIPASTTPCGGCGAHLHCQDTAVPGYLPKEIFHSIKKKQLQAVVCQRCHFLREYNTALNISVSPEEYPNIISQIKTKNKALIILVVDMTDFPCSIWPGILDLLGPKRPLIVVGNKIDLLQDASKEWMQRAKESLMKHIPSNANLLHIELVSAKTGYGIENLISALYKLWDYRGDVYMVGCTNVGKSTLFNSLLGSDYCKNKAADLLQRATTAPWPGTTLNFLKFPILRPNPYRMAMRSRRLRFEKNTAGLDEKGRPSPNSTRDIKRTFTHGNTDMYNDDYHDDPFALPKMQTLKGIKTPGTGVDEKDSDFSESKWFYDTPGVVTRDQIIDLLTPEELLKVLPNKPLLPRTFQIWPGQSLLLAGLGRLDYLNGPNNIKMTVLAAYCLPVTICFIKDADAVYQHYLGTEGLMVPEGGADRLKQWPGLQSGEPFVLKGAGWRESCADVVLSSTGWVAVTAKQDTLCQFQAWTPEARGIHVRLPPALPKAIALKGCRMYKTPAYAVISRHKRRYLPSS